MGGHDAAMAYAKALVADAGLFAKVVGFKKNTVKAYAGNGCDSPICDQLVFLYEWLCAEMPDAMINLEAGIWVFNKEKGFTTVKPGDISDGDIKAIQPQLKNPKDEASLMKMRTILEENLLNFLLANAVRQKLAELLRSEGLDSVEEKDFGSLWSTLDPQQAFAGPSAAKVAAAVAGTNGVIDLKKFLNWAVV
mmetsp:Transcript_140937/g.244058  ORF Transcript_140937/g.244058 Transcript_140937/m.244058 type:complete len:193 (-) Transcript_140937:94-672(-)